MSNQLPRTAYNLINIMFICFSTLVYPANHTNAITGITIPLRYNSQYGIYTARLLVGQNPTQTAEAIVDTGSAIMVLVADKTYCPSCSSALTTGVINPLQIDALNPNKEITINYGSANDTVVEYVAPIQYSDNVIQQFKMKVYVLKKSTQPTSIIGMIQHNLLADPVTSTPFMVKLMEQFNSYTDVTFVLCGNKGKSYFHAGPIKLPQPLVRTKLLTSQFYEIASSGFYNENNKPIAKPSQRDGRAILDTGTGGFIILTPALYKPLYDYIYKNAGTKNQALNKKFWQKNYCILRSAINFDALPIIKIGLISLEDNRPNYLNLPPQIYINQAGCGTNHVRFIFDQSSPSGIFTAIRNHRARVAAGSTPDMVIGTALFNNYAIKISYKPEPFVAIYDNKKLCIPQTQ